MVAWPIETPPPNVAAPANIGQISTSEIMGNSFMWVGFSASFSVSKIFILDSVGIRAFTQPLRF
jgi:hypothetical protein